jgi:hypothetical protein
MKKRLPTLYYVIPVVYLLVIAFFVLMQFRSRESFRDDLGALVVSGSYSRSLSAGRQIRELTVSCNDVRLRFGRLLLQDPGPARSRRLRVLSYSHSEQAVELACSEEVRLRFSLSGEPAGTVVLEPVIPAALAGMRILSLPLELGGEEAGRVRGIPLLRLGGKHGIRYAALPAGSNIDLQAGRLEMNLLAAGEQPRVLFDRVDPAHDDPYLYWFSRSGPLADENRYREALDRFLDGAWAYWNRVLLGTPGDPALAEQLGACLLSEAARRGEYRRVLPGVGAVMRARGGAGGSYRVAAYVGYLLGFQAESARASEELIERITEAIRRSDPAVLDVPGLMRLLVNRGPFSLTEEALRLADGVDRSTAPAARLLSLLEVYTEAAVLLGQPLQQKISELIDDWLLPSVLQTREGLFLAQLTGGPEGRVEAGESARAGRLFLQAAEITSRPALATVGRSLLLAVISLADSEGFVPARGSILSGRFRPQEDQLAPEQLYGRVAEQRYLPEEYTLYGQLSPGAWLYTAAAPVRIRAGTGQYRFSFGFPAGGSHYFLLQGVQPVKSVLLHGILWKPDPEYSQYSDGWVYEPGTQTLFGKITHRLPEEDLVLNF